MPTPDGSIDGIARDKSLPNDLFARIPQETVEGTVLRIRFTNEEDSWSVVVISQSGSGREIVAVGNLAGARAGENLRLTGRWTTHPKYGERFEVESFSGLKPATVEGIRKYLSSGLVKGIGEELAGRLVDGFGLETLDVIEGSPERLREVEGIGPERSRRIVEAWNAQKDIREIIVFLQSYGVSTSLAAKIFRRYGKGARRLLEENPYRLAEEIPGVGFLTADRIALQFNGDRQSPRRIEAGVVFALREKADEGHTVVDRSGLAEESARLLGASDETCIEAVGRLAARGAVVVEQTDKGPLVGLPALVAAEKGAADILAALAAFPVRKSAIRVDAEIVSFEKRNGITLSVSQRDAAHQACVEKVLIVTGGPGTGKTTLLKGILAVLGAGGAILLCAPTGRAAKRMREATGGDARTIHRLLEYSPQKGDFIRDRGNPLHCDLLIVDEASMIDAPLFHRLLQALPLHCRLILVGDKDQLPSVGPGNVLGDLIRSGKVPTVFLTEVFRQAEKSSIVLNAHRINRGESPALGGDESSDFFFIERNEPEAIISTVRELVRRRIPDRFHLDPREDIQVLTPMQRGALGAIALNRELQSSLNPEGPAVSRGSSTYRVADRVMQLRNNYELGVYNGDIGRISAVDAAAETVSVRFDERTVTYEWMDLDEISLAYACTIHKSQGSEFPAAVIVLHAQAYILLARNLLYTAVTRGRRLVVIVGSRKALAIAVKNASARTRSTLFAERLKDAFS